MVGFRDLQQLIAHQRQHFRGSEPRQGAEDLVHQVVDGKEARQRGEEQEGRKQCEEEVVRELGGPTKDIVRGDRAHNPPEHITPPDRYAKRAQEAHGWSSSARSIVRERLQAVSTAIHVPQEVTAKERLVPFLW